MTRWLPTLAPLAAALALAACADGAHRSPEPLASPAARDGATPPVAAAVAGGIGDPAPALPPAAPAERPAGVGEGLLVWGADGEGGTYTWWLEPDGQGAWDVIEAEGAILAVDGTLRRWSTATGALPTQLDCELLEEVPGHATGTGVTAQLEPLVDGDPLVVMEPLRQEARESAEHVEQVYIEASVGPYLFVRREVYQYHCGAHGGSTHAFLVLDARDGSALSLYPSDPGPGLRDRAWRRYEADMLLADDPGEVSRTTYLPRFGAAGVTMQHQLTAPACYACSDGEWDSYTISVKLPDPQVPEPLRGFAERIPPGALGWLAEQVDGLVVGGVGFAPAALRPAFAELEVHGC